jgi:hypothetical protein
MGESDLLLGPHEQSVGGIGAVGARPHAPYGPYALPPSRHDDIAVAVARLWPRTTPIIPSGWRQVTCTNQFA